MRAFSKLQRISLISYHVTIASLKCYSRTFSREQCKRKFKFHGFLPALSKQNHAGKMGNKPDLGIPGRLGPHCRAKGLAGRSSLAHSLECH